MNNLLFHPRIRRTRPLWVMTAGGLLLALVTALWLSYDRGICPPTDSEHHLFNSLLFARTMHLGGLPALWTQLRTHYVGWPPASYLFLYSPLAWAFSENAHIVRGYGILLIPLLLFGTYRVGRILGGRRSATLAALLTIFSLGVAGQLRQVSIDLPAAGVVTLTLFALLRCRRFGDTHDVLLFGVAGGLCLLTRVQSVFYMAGPTLLLAGTALARAPSWAERGKVVGRLLLGLLLCLAVSSPWWGGHLRSLWNISTSHLDPTQIEPRGDPGFLAGVLYYLNSLGKISGWPMVAAALALMPQIVKRRQPGDLLLLTVIIGGVLGCSMGVHREPRYLLPAVPALALLTAGGLRALSPRARGLAGAALLLTVVGPTLYFSGWGIPGRSPLVTSGLMEWGYTRPAYKLRPIKVAGELNKVLLKASGNDERGKNIYLLFVQEKDINFLPRMGSHLVARFPDMVFAYSFNINIVNNRWNIDQRRKRWLFLLTETKRAMELPLIWHAPRGRHGNATPLNLYRVPLNHPFYGRINFYKLHWGKSEQEVRKAQRNARKAAAGRRKAGEP